jgi:hypothetical protein
MLGKLRSFYSLHHWKHPTGKRVTLILWMSMESVTRITSVGFGFTGLPVVESYLDFNYFKDPTCPGGRVLVR